MDNTGTVRIKKKIKKAKPPKPVYNEFVCSPELQKDKPVSVVLGFIFRSAVVYIGVLGMILFICDAFKIPLNVFALMGVIAVITAVFCVMSINSLFFWCGLCLSAVTAAIAAYLSGHPVMYFMNSVGTLWNHMLDRLDYAGYRIMTSLYLPVDNTVIFTEAETAAFMFFAVILITLVIAAVFVFSLIRRTRILPLLIVSALIMTSIFTYNISSSNWGFSLIVASVCGIISLRMYDGIYNRKKTPGENIADSSPQRSLKTSAMGGYIGFISMALCFMVLLLPTLGVKKQWETIRFINDKMELGRAIVSSIIIGETPDIDMGFIGNMDTMNSRSTIADERTFSGREMLRVYASYNMPLYLRSWIATSYNDEEDAWNAVSTSKASQYTSWFYSGFTPEVINFNFYDLVNPKLTAVNSFTSYSNHIEDGFITETIDVENLNSSGNLLFTATAYNPSLGLMNFLSTDKNDLYSGEWKFYYEGIVTTSWFNFEKQYRMTAFVPSYRYEGYSARLENNLRYYSLMKYYILQSEGTDLSPDKQQSVIDSAREMLAYYNVEYTEPTALERYFGLSETEKAAFIYNHFTLPDYYESFVYKEYTSVPDSDALKNIASEVEKTLDESKTGELSENGIAQGNNVSTHDTVMAVIDYLKEACEYTLNPRAPRNTRLSALNAFLTDTKQGYCVQFATSAAMVLRQMGIPARYVEGYLINGLKYDKTPERLAKYQTIVRDYNAHAWIEVYMGAAGWKLYETTPEYYSDLYEPYTTSSGEVSYTPMPEIEPPEIPDDDGSDIVNKNRFKFDAKTVLTIALITAAAAGIIFAVFVIVRMRSRSIRTYEKRYETLNRALRSRLEPAELRNTARQMNDYIWQLHDVAGCVPEKGELPAEYAARVDDSINASLFSFSDILKYMNSEEFGYGMTRWQLREEAEYMRTLWDKLLSGMPAVKKFRLRHMKRLI